MACILVLEDDAISARLVARMLKANGHEVLTAPKSSQAWVQMQESPVDLLLLDTQLDGEHGWEFLEKIRQDILFKDLPVVVYSSVTQREVIKRYLTLGVQGILVKPATAERLNQEVARQTRQSWRNGLFESEDAVEARIGMAPGEVTRLYRQAASDLRSAIPDLSGLVQNIGDKSLQSRIGALKSCAINIGYTRLVSVLDALADAVSGGDAQRVQTFVERLTTALRLLVIQSGGDMMTLSPMATDGELPEADVELAAPSVEESPAA